MTQGAAYGGKDQALINIRPRLPRIKLDHRSGRFLVAPSIRLGSPPSKGRNQCQRCFSRATASSPVTLLSSQAMVPISHPPIIAPIRPQRQALLTERLRSSPNRRSSLARTLVERLTGGLMCRGGRWAPPLTDRNRPTLWQQCRCGSPETPADGPPGSVTSSLIHRPLLPKIALRVCEAAACSFCPIRSPVICVFVTNGLAKGGTSFFA